MCTLKSDDNAKKANEHLWAYGQVVISIIIMYEITDLIRISWIDNHRSQELKRRAVIVVLQGQLVGNLDSWAWQPANAGGYTS